MPWPVRLCHQQIAAEKVTASTESHFWILLDGQGFGVQSSLCMGNNPKNVLYEWKAVGLATATDRGTLPTKCAVTEVQSSLAKPLPKEAPVTFLLNGISARAVAFIPELKWHQEAIKQVTTKFALTNKAPAEADMDMDALLVVEARVVKGGFIDFTFIWSEPGGALVVALPDIEKGKIEEQVKKEFLKANPGFDLQRKDGLEEIGQFTSNTNVYIDPKRNQGFKGGESVEPSVEAGFGIPTSNVWAIASSDPYAHARNQKSKVTVRIPVSNVQALVPRRFPAALRNRKGYVAVYVSFIGPAPK